MLMLIFRTMRIQIEYNCCLMYIFHIFLIVETSGNDRIPDTWGYIAGRQILIRCEYGRYIIGITVTCYLWITA